MSSETAWRAGVGAVCALILNLLGCVPLEQLGADSSTGDDRVLGSVAQRPDPSSTFREVEPNEDYLTAQPITVDGAADVTGTIRPNQIDRDLYDLGPASAGDRLRAELTLVSKSQAVLGVLDQRGTLIGFLDLSTSAAGPSKLDVFLHEDTDHLFVAVTNRSAAASEQSYTARLTFQRGVGVPEDRPQIVVLSFQGAKNVRIGGRSSLNVPVFDASSISPRFAGKTGLIVQNIMTMVAQAYEGLGVQIFQEGDPSIPDGPRSTVYFGTYDSQLLGLADNVDPYNSDSEQSAILYTDTFALFDALSPDVEAISQVLANTTCHEIGHLLGLRHTSDVHDIMDTTASARQMMVRQSFRTAGINSSVMSFGLQDAPSLLAWAVGGVLVSQPGDSQLAARQKAVQLASRGLDFYIPRDRLASETESQDAGVP